MEGVGIREGLGGWRLCITGTCDSNVCLHLLSIHLQLVVALNNRSIRKKKQYKHFERCQNGFEAIIDKSFLVSIRRDLCENRLKFGRSSRQVHNNLPTK